MGWCLRCLILGFEFNLGVSDGEHTKTSYKLYATNMVHPYFKGKRIHAKIFETIIQQKIYWRYEIHWIERERPDYVHFSILIKFYSLKLCLWYDSTFSICLCVLPITNYHILNLNFINILFRCLIQRNRNLSKLYELEVRT